MRPGALVLCAVVGCQSGGSADLGPTGGTATGTATGAGTGTGGTGTGTGTATGSGTGTGTGTGGSGSCVPILGCGTHDLSNLTVETVIDMNDGLRIPRDLAFHPTADELWIVNQLDDSCMIAKAAGTPSMQVTKYVNADNQQHFMAQPSGLAFRADDGTWASIHETDELTQGPLPWGTPEDFMGPTLWTGNSAIFDGGTDSHLDMLHNSPNGVGIAWEGQGNVYWVYDGYHQSLTRYDFRADHGLGGVDHDDGVVRRYVRGELGYLPGVSSHVVVDTATQLVYAADSATDAIVVLDPSTATSGGAYGPNYDGGDQTEMTGASLDVFVDGPDFGLEVPSGLELFDGMLFVTDNQAGTISAFAMDGSLVDWVDLGVQPGALMGIAFDPRDDSLWFVDAVDHEVRQITLP